MRPERGGIDFVEEAGGHLMRLLLPLLLFLDDGTTLLLLVEDFWLTTLRIVLGSLTLVLSTFIGVISDNDVIAPPDCWEAPSEGTEDDELLLR